LIAASANSPSSNLPASASPQGRPLHVVHFYQEDRALIEELTTLVRVSLGKGDAAIIVATKNHANALERQLKAEGLDVTGPKADGQFICLDSTESLALFMVDGMPDEEKFLKVFGRVVEQAEAAKAEDRGIVIFGEMVATLFTEGNHKAAIRLEELWNELSKKYTFSLRCAYPMEAFSSQEHAGPFMQICKEHSSVVPHSGSGKLSSDDDRVRTIAKLQQQLQVLEYEKALHESEQRFRLLIDAVQDYAIFMLDASGRVSSWNLGAERMKGYQSEEIVGKHFSCFYPEADIAAGKPERLMNIALRNGRVEDEGWRVRKDGSMFWANVVITLLKDKSSKVVGFSKVTRDITEKMQAEKALRNSQRELQESEKSLRQLSRHLLRTQEEERRRIGRELHDSVGQYLTALKMKLDVLNRPSGLPGKELVRRHLSECSELADELIKDVRTISYLLYPPMLEEIGLNSAISWYLDGFSKRSGITTTFHTDNTIVRLPTDVEVALYRILQESLTNVHRHSGSPSAVVRLLLRGGEVQLEVSDKGKGMPPLQEAQAGQDWIGTFGVGLRGMNERIRQLGGKLDLVSGPEGTTITASVACKNVAT
jgi:PAS domain S-box-containing protein